MEYTETEKVDTSYLCSEPMEGEEVHSLFSLDLVTTKAEKNREELDHLTRVILTSTGRALASAFPGRIGHWENCLPKHHPHPLDYVKLEEAATRLMPPHHRQVTYGDKSSLFRERIQLECL